MTPQQFVDKWRGVQLKERSAAQEHFIDVCRLVGHPTPAEYDPAGERFTFEKGAGEGARGGRFASEGEAEKRTLTNLCTERPTWLALAHERLDAAVSAAYGWPAELSDEEILARLLALNLERAAG